MSKTLTPDEWVDFLILVGATESPAEYAEWVISKTPAEIAQVLGNQPELTPDVKELIEWAEGVENES